MTKQQAEAATFVKDLLASRNLQIEAGIVIVAEEGWQIFEYENRCIGIDPSSGIWIGNTGE